MFGNLMGRVGETLSRATAGEPQLVLTVSMAFRPEGTMVEVMLTRDSEPVESAPRWEAPYATFQGTAGFVVSEDLMRQMHDWLTQQGRPMGSGAVWLRLARPYGFLGVVPWEAGMGAVFGRPILRLPDFPARAAERTDVLENVVVVDPPNRPDMAEEVRRRLDALIDAILAGTSRDDTGVHVFCSARWYRLLQSDTGDERVHFYTPGPDGREDETSARSGVSLWTDWILASMAGRGIDAVHLVGRAAMGEAEGCYLMSCTPFEPRGFVPDVEVDLEALSLLLSRAGAWSVSFIPVLAEFRDSMAWVADGLAHRWPGAVLFNAGPDVGVLGMAARLLYNTSATAAPRFDDGFLYCHPTFLSRKQQPLAAALAPILAEQAALLAARAPVSERMLSWVTRVLPGVNQIHQSAPPAWLGATQRFLESEVLDGLRRGAADVMLTDDPARRAGMLQRVEFNSGTEEVLKEMRSVVERYLKEKREEDSDERPVSDSRDSPV